jgi:hypothetical protein
LLVGFDTAQSRLSLGVKCWVAPEIPDMLEKKRQDITAALPIQQLSCKITHRIVGELYFWQTH